MVRDWISKPLTLALGLGLCFGLASTASAQNYIRRGPAYCPPANCPTCPPGSFHTAPSTTTPSTTPSTSPSTSPSTTPSTDPNAPTPPTTDPNAAQNQNQNQQQNQPQQNPQDFSQAPTADASGAGGPMSSGAMTPFAGRLDSNNRFNLFDNMTAVPQNRVWVGYMYTDGTNSQAKISDDGKAFLASAPLLAYARYGNDIPITNRSNQNTYRFGAEVMLCEDLSIAAMGQYVDPTGDGAQSTFSNPQFMLKYVLAQDENCVLSATFGYQPDTGINRKEVKDLSSRYYPGLIAYTQLTDDHFMQASGQFGLPQSGDLYTADWALSFGYWLYRHESLDPRYYRAMRGSNSNACLLGVVPQIEVFGHHVLGDTTYKGVAGMDEAPIGPVIGLGLLNDPFFIGEEPRHIFDATAAIQWILCNNMVLGTGVSIPLNDSANSVRRVEFLATLNYNF